MGLFSFLNKNKQEIPADDGAYQARDDDDAIALKARSKRASSAGEPAARRSKDSRAAVDPVLPEKKRARRRLVGAIALALAVAVGLPMILDAEEKPRGTDIDIRIPSKDKAPALPMPAAVAPAESLDKREQIVEAPLAAPVATPAAVAPPPMKTLPPEPAAVKLVTVKTEPKPVVKSEKVADKAPAKPVEAKPVEAKPVAAKPVKTDEQRAMAILEGKPAAAAAPAKLSLQVAALSSQEKVNELLARLKAEGIPASTQKSANGELIRVRVGPFSKEDADKVRTKLDKLGLSAKALPN